MGLLYSLDYTKYEVDLQLYENAGPYLGLIPPQVHLLPPARRLSHNKLLGSLQRAARPSYWYHGVRAALAHRRYPNTLAAAQEAAYARARASWKNPKVYDVAVGFMEMWPDAYVLTRVTARKKIGWIHVDYPGAGLVKQVDEKPFSRFSQFVLVSGSCRRSFCETFPAYRDRAVSIENVIRSEAVRKRAGEAAPSIAKGGSALLFGSVCRIEFRHKGLDRALRIFSSLKKRGYLFQWHIIGGGADRQELDRLIEELDLRENVVLHGAKNNPLPYVKQFDVFLLPSRYEGKPMVVTEAQMLGVPAVVTNYASAREQVSSGIDGLVVENSEDGIEAGLRYVLDHPEQLERWRRNLAEKEWDCAGTIRQIDGLLGEGYDGS